MNVGCNATHAVVHLGTHAGDVIGPLSDRFGGLIKGAAEVGILLFREQRVIAGNRSPEFPLIHFVGAGQSAGVGKLFHGSCGEHLCKKSGPEDFQVPHTVVIGKSQSFASDIDDEKPKLRLRH